MEFSPMIPPFLIFYLGAVFAIFARGRLQSLILVAIPLLGFLNLAGLDHGFHWPVMLFGHELFLVRVDKLSLLFGFLFHLASLIGIVFALHIKDRIQIAASVIYAGSALGAVFANDLIILFLFWEMLAISSVFLIWSRRTERAYRAGLRYLIIQIVSGVILLAGAMIARQETGSLTFNALDPSTFSGGLVLLAFGIKACFPLLHNWLTDAYPESTVTGAVFLSAFSTKVAIYALLRGYAGTEILIYIGAVMAVFPLFFAAAENDLRRALSYNLVNQLGFMVVGVGLGSQLAINGVAAHAFSHVLYQSILFMSMGAVLHRTGEIRASHLGNLGKHMPWTAGFYTIGAINILLSGIIAKSMIMVAALEMQQFNIWVALLFGTAGVFYVAAVRIPYLAFFRRDTGVQVAEAPPNMLIAMGVAAFVSVFNGFYPWILYGLLPLPVDYDPFEIGHVLAQIQLVVFAALAFVWLNLTGKRPTERAGINLDAEWFYRRAAPVLVKNIDKVLQPLNRAAREQMVQRTRQVIAAIFRHHGPEGVMARTWPIGNTVIWVTVLLVLYLITYYL